MITVHAHVSPAVRPFVFSPERVDSDEYGTGHLVLPDFVFPKCECDFPNWIKADNRDGVRIQCDHPTIIFNRSVVESLQVYTSEMVGEDQVFLPLEIRS